MNYDSEILESKEHSLKDIVLLKSMVKYLKRYTNKFLIVIFLDIIVTVAFTMESVILKYLTDILSGTFLLFDSLTYSVIFFVLLDLVSMTIAGVLAYFCSMTLKKIGQCIVADLRRDLFAHILSLSAKQMKIMKIGSFVTRVTNDTQNISSFFTDILPQVLRASFTLIIIIIMTFIFLKLYGFIYLAFIPFVFLFSYIFRRKARVYYRSEKASISRMNSFLSESFTGIKVTKSYGREDRKEIEFIEHNDAIYNSFIRSQNLFALFYPLMYLLQMICVLIVLAFGIPAALALTISIGDFQLLYSYSLQFFSPVQTITQQLNMLQNVITSGERIVNILNMEPEIVSTPEDIDVPTFKGKIEFKHVYFAYEGEDYVLRDVSFTIPEGKTAAFVGATGAGKSTIISLITRTYIPQKGQILIDDIDISNYSLECLRRNIGIMLQDVFLFSGTIKSNITLDDENISDSEVINCSKEVGADVFINRLEKGYESEVKERGDNFSSGQKQLLSFARTLVYHPSMILLDEATANIDTESENIIQSSLEKIRKIGTMVIVAHRLSTIKNADIIFVVSKGEIIESGDHQQLLKNRGIYYNLYRLQNLEKDIKEA